jgi:hypothetical protein
MNFIGVYLTAPKISRRRRCPELFKCAGPSEKQGILRPGERHALRGNTSRKKLQMEE